MKSSSISLYVYLLSKTQQYDMMARKCNSATASSIAERPQPNLNQGVPLAWQHSLVEGSLPVDSSNHSTTMSVSSNNHPSVATVLAPRSTFDMTHKVNTYTDHPGQAFYPGGKLPHQRGSNNTPLPISMNGLEGGSKGLELGTTDGINTKHTIHTILALPLYILYSLSPYTQYTH